MYVKLMVAATALVMALAATPGAMATNDNANGGSCAVEDVGCYCADSSGKSCGGLTGQKNCEYSAGPTPGIQVGILCDWNLTAIFES